MLLLPQWTKVPLKPWTQINPSPLHHWGQVFCHRNDKVTNTGSEGISIPHAFNLMEIHREHGKWGLAVLLAKCCHAVPLATFALVFMTVVEPRRICQGREETQPLHMNNEFLPRTLTPYRGALGADPLSSDEVGVPSFALSPSVLSTSWEL